jgi:uracil-DNA glycosylase family 4
MKQELKKGLTSYYASVRGCKLCYGERCRITVPGSHSKPGGPGVRVLVVGEQPARDGEAGEDTPNISTLTSFLDKSGIERRDVYYTTAVLCIPEKTELRPGRPTPPEARNCAAHLKRLIDLLHPQVIVPLGHTSIHAVQWVFDGWPELRRFILNYDCGTVLERNGVAVYPLYHPSQSTWSARPRSRQLRDWQRIPAILESLRSRAAS